MARMFMLGMILFLSLTATQAQSKRAGSDFLLKIERMSCRGNCPSFIVTVDKSGKVAYEGRRNVKNIGKFTKQLSKAQVKEIAGLMSQYQFFQYKDLYDNTGVSDLVSCIVTYTNKGTTKSVNARYEVPASFEELEKKLETIIGEEGFNAVK